MTQTAPSTAPVLPSGEQWTLRYGDQEAVVVEVGGGLRTYTVGDKPLLSGYAEDEQCSSGRGQLLMPWPNRVRDGRYQFGGKGYQLALSEPPRSNAIHGLVRWSLWTLLEHRDEALTVGCRLRPQQGWAWSLDLTVGYELGKDGLTVTPSARNVGAADAPFGFGVHPYLTLGEARVDELRLTLPASQALEVDERLLPVQLRSVDGAADGKDLDFRDGRLLADTQLDTAFTGLQADADGRWRVHLAHEGSGRGLVLWGDAAAYPWLQVFTGDSLAEGSIRTTGVAVEPMTCGPDALRSGDDLLVLAPGERFGASWGIAPQDAAPQ